MIVTIEFGSCVRERIIQINDNENVSELLSRSVHFNDTVLCSDLLSHCVMRLEGLQPCRRGQLLSDVSGIHLLSSICSVLSSDILTTHQ